MHWRKHGMARKAKLNVFQELFFNYICMVLNQCESDKLIQLCFQPFLFRIFPKEDTWIDVIDLFTWPERETDRKKNMQVGGLIPSFVNGFIFKSIWKADIILCVCVTISFIGSSSSTCSLSAVSESMYSMHYPFSRKEQSYNTPLWQLRASVHNE